MAGGVGSLHQEASYDKSKRGGFEPGKEEPGGVGGAEVIWGGGVEGDELGGQGMPRRGPNFFPRRFESAPVVQVLLTLSEMKVKFALAFFRLVSKGM